MAVGNNDSRFLEVSSHDALYVEEDEQGFFLAVVCNKGAEARAAGVVPDLHPGVDLEATGLEFGAVLEGIRDVVFWRWRLQISTRQAGAIHRQVPLTVERSLHGLAKESLTFFPDHECCPPSSLRAAARNIALLVLGQKGELVGRGQRGEGGACWWGWDT